MSEISLRIKTESPYSKKYHLDFHVIIMNIFETMHFQIIRIIHTDADGHRESCVGSVLCMCLYVMLCKSVMF